MSFAEKMTLLLEPSYPSTRGYYTLRELQLLASVLGYDSKLFQRGLQDHGITITDKDRYTEAEIYYWLDSKLLHKELDHIFNRYTGDYNVIVMKRALHHLHQHSLTFSEVGRSRRAFESQTYDQLGMSANVDVILYTLKIINKVIPPLKLEHLLKVMSKQFDTPQKLKLYNFLDIVAQSTPIGQLPLVCSEGNDDIKVDGLFETPYHKLLSTLNTEYKASITKLKVKQQQRPLEQTTKSFIDTSKWKTATLASKQTGESLTPYIKSSVSSIQLARTGQRPLSVEQGLRVLTRLSTRESNCRLTPFYFNSSEY